MENRDRKIDEIAKEEEKKKNVMIMFYLKGFIDNFLFFYLIPRIASLLPLLSLFIILYI